MYNKGLCFDSAYPEVDIPNDPSGALWNPYVHTNFTRYFFEIWRRIAVPI